MNDALRAKLLLNACRAPSTAWEALKRSDSPASLWTEGEEFRERLGIRVSSRARLAELIAERDWADRELDRVDRFGARFIAIDDVEYPVRLKDLASPPTGIYVKGELNLQKSMTAIVGTRRASPYGRAVAGTIGRVAARAEHQVVSGGAKGIDGAGHRGCLEEGGTTVAVLGTAVDRVYPAEHRPLFHKIAEQGALLSEYPMGTGGDPWRFPERNRLIVALCSRLVVAESPEDGGSMITARLALDLGREIWSVPGRITEEICRGSNALIRDGANPLIDIDDFIEKISGQYGQMLLDFTGNVSFPELTDSEKNVLELLHQRGGRTLDDIMEESGLSFVDVQSCLATLCASGLVCASAGRYSAGSRDPKF